MVKEELIFEIGDIIHIRYKLFGGKLTPEEIMDSYEYKQFKKKHPEICRIAEKG